MIKTRKLVPEIYYDKSRDFQFLGRIFEINYNYAKTNVDLLNTLPLSNNSDLRLVNLVLTTLGFTRKHEYNSHDLKKISQVFSELIRYKGTKKSVELAVNALLNAQNIDAVAHVEDVYDGMTHKKLYEFAIYLPIELDDVVLLEDLFDYILPAGYSYRLYFTEMVKGSISNITGSSSITSYTYSDANLSKIAKPETRDELPQESGEDLGLTFTTRVYKPVEGE